MTKILKIVVLALVVVLIALFGHSEWYEAQLATDTHVITIDEIGTYVIDRDLDKNEFLRRFDTAFAQDTLCSGLSLVHWRSSSSGYRETVQESEMKNRSAWRITFNVSIGGQIRWAVNRHQSRFHPTFTWVDGDGSTVQQVAHSICTVVQGRGGLVAN